jgi:enoyl-CoA hydratase/carnithine racemase
MSRSDGVLVVRVHSDGGPLIWGDVPHEELGYCFAEIGSDRENRVIILTGTGDSWISRLDDSWVSPTTPVKWDRMLANGKRLLRNLVDIEVPVIGAVNGRASVHAELILLSDIVIATEDAVFSDSPHFRFGAVPSDGTHVLWPLWLGPNRGRHFLLSARRIDAEEALRLGLISEIVRADDLLPRAHEIAASLAQWPDTVLRNTREALMQGLRRLLLESVGHGLALEGLAAYAHWPGHTSPEEPFPRPER